MKILIFVESLQMGGVERGVAKLGNHWAAQGRDVSIVTFTDKESDFYPLHERIRRIPLNLMGPRKTLHQKIMLQLKRWHHFTRTVRSCRPDFVLSFGTNCNILALQTSWLYKAPTIISERTDPRRKNLKMLQRLQRRAFYPFAKKIVFVSAGVASVFDWIRPDKKTVIFNALEPGPPVVDTARGKTIVGLGRLMDVKGFDMLIGAFARISAAHPDWTLIIHGDGPCRSALESLIGQKNLTSRARLAGPTRAPFEVLQKAGLFVLSSRYEGFPNALMEAMAVGTPCISFDCPSGPNEMMTSGHDGLLVPAENETLLAEAMSIMIDRPDERIRMGRNALAINDRLNIEKIIIQWEAVMDETGRGAACR